MTKSWHLTEEGPKVCVTTPDRCRKLPLMGASAVEHYESIIEATRAYENYLESTVVDFNNEPGFNLNQVYQGELNGRKCEFLDYSLRLNQEAEITVNLLREAGMSPLVVGGSVRDALIGAPSKDFDIEAYGAPNYKAISEVLGKHGSINVTGKSFGVLKFRPRLLDGKLGAELDVSLPRTESKTGVGHTGFEVFSDSDLTPYLASLRRDLTINALMFDPRKNRVIDLHGGLRDILNKRLHFVSKAFAEDPLRVLRVARFASKLGYTSSPELTDLSIRLKNEFSSLPKERIKSELERTLNQNYPERGLEFLAACGWDKKLGFINDECLVVANTLVKNKSKLKTLSDSKKHEMSLAIIASVSQSKNKLELVKMFTVADKPANMATKMVNTEEPDVDSVFSAKLWAFSSKPVRACDKLLLTEIITGKNLSKARSIFEKAKVLNGSEPDRFNSLQIIQNYKQKYGLTKDGPWIKDLLHENRLKQYKEET